MNIRSCIALFLAFGPIVLAEPAPPPTIAVVSDASDKQLSVLTDLIEVELGKSAVVSALSRTELDTIFAERAIQLSFGKAIDVQGLQRADFLLILERDAETFIARLIQSATGVERMNLSLPSEGNQHKIAAEVAEKVSSAIRAPAAAARYQFAIPAFLCESADFGDIHLGTALVPFAAGGICLYGIVLTSRHRRSRSSHVA